MNPVISSPAPSPAGSNGDVSGRPARPPLPVAVVGIGGFGWAHHNAVRVLEARGHMRLIATCDPAREDLQDRCAHYAFAARGVAVYADLSSLLAAHARELDLVSIVSPIRYHAEHHRACVERGIACHLEKPPTLDPRELAEMLRVEQGARYATQIGFNHIGQAWRQQLKARLLAGEFGRLERVSFLGLWRRPESYYRRNSWAGKLLLGEYLLLDSCCGNAMAHYVHNLLFHAGTEGVMSWAAPAMVEAELYRVNEIESPDTIFARGLLGKDVEFRLATTHACAEAAEHVEIIECTDARIELPAVGAGSIARRDGTRESVPTSDGSAGPMVESNLAAYADYVMGRIARPTTRLEETGPFVNLNALLYLAAGRITCVDPRQVQVAEFDPETGPARHVPGMNRVCVDFIRTGRLPSESGVPWSQPGGHATKTASSWDRLAGTLQAMARAR